MGSKFHSRPGTRGNCPDSLRDPFRYETYAVEYLTQTQEYASVPVKQAVISASALSLLYPDEGIDGHPRATFLDDLVDEVETDIRQCLEAGAHAVQIDFTEGRFAVKLDSSKELLRQWNRPRRCGTRSCGRRR